ncbi:MAG: ATP-binding cassette domain-containing protein [Paracoccus sp. (in: a-proteobacteria)]
MTSIRNLLISVRPLLRNRAAMLGALILIAVVLAAILASVLAPYAPNKLSIVNKLQAPSGAHLFGIDEFGRDILSRAIYAGRVSLMVSLGVVALSTVLGVILGIAAGFFVRLDGPISRLLDAMMSFPDILLAIALVAALGPSLPTVIIALGITYAPRLARIVRGSTLVLREMPYIEAAITLGLPTWKVLSRHLLLNLASPILVQATFVFASAMLAEASLSFLGVGVSADMPTWGTMLASGREFMNNAPWLMIFPGLTTSFRASQGWKDVVRGITFGIHAGETVAVVGESGSDQSVTALSAMRLLSRDRSRSTGRILLEGRDLLTLPEAQMRSVRGGSIGMILQEPMTSLNPVFTIGNQLAEALVLPCSTSWKEAEAPRLMERVRIPAAKIRLHEYPHKFSGGMRQRVMIAMALACRPKLLIADEPTTALDVTIQAEILSLIRELRAESDMGVLFITHDMGVVAEVADRTVVMFRGDMVETGDTAAIFARPTKPYTRALLASIPRLGTMGGALMPRRFPQVDPATGLASEGTETAPPPPSDKPVVRVSNLSIRFDLPNGRVHAVEDVSFELYPGETLALVGESGCGKSTTGRAIMRLNTPTAGEILVDGQNVATARPGKMRALRRSAQMIFQDPFASLNPRITVGSAVMEPT